MKTKRRPKGRARIQRKPKRVLPTVKTIIAQKPTEHIMCFFGPPGIGKTTFVDSLADNVLFLSSDRGTRFFKGLREEVNDYPDYLEVLDSLDAVADNLPYDIVCIDHMDDMASAAEDYVLDKLGIEALGDAGYGKGWKAYKKAMLRIVSRLKALDVGIVFICHETIKTVKTRAIETDRTMPGLSKSAWNVIIPLCDLVGYMGFRRIKTKAGKKEVHTLQTAPTEAIYCKDRTRRSKPEKGYEILGVPPIGGKAFIQTFSTTSTPSRKTKKKARKHG